MPGHVWAPVSASNSVELSFYVKTGSDGFALVNPTLSLLVPSAGKPLVENSNLEGTNAVDDLLILEVAAPSVQVFACHTKRLQLDVKVYLALLGPWGFPAVS